MAPEKPNVILRSREPTDDVELPPGKVRGLQVEYLGPTVAQSIPTDKIEEVFDEVKKMISKYHKSGYSPRVMEFLDKDFSERLREGRKHSRGILNVDQMMIPGPVCDIEPKEILSAIATTQDLVQLARGLQNAILPTLQGDGEPRFTKEHISVMYMVDLFYSCHLEALDIVRLVHGYWYGLTNQGMMITGCIDWLRALQTEISQAEWCWKKRGLMIGQWERYAEPTESARINVENYSDMLLSGVRPAKDLVDMIKRGMGHIESWAGRLLHDQNELRLTTRRLIAEKTKALRDHFTNESSETIKRILCAAVEMGMNPAASMDPDIMFSFALNGYPPELKDAMECREIASKYLAQEGSRLERRLFKNVFKETRGLFVRTNLNEPIAVALAIQEHLREILTKEGRENLQLTWLSAALDQWKRINDIMRSYKGQMGEEPTIEIDIYKNYDIGTPQKMATRASYLDQLRGVCGESAPGINDNPKYRRTEDIFCRDCTRGRQAEGEFSMKEFICDKCGDALHPSWVFVRDNEKEWVQLDGLRGVFYDVDAKIFAKEPLILSFRGSTDALALFPDNVTPKFLSPRGDREDQIFEAFKSCRPPEIEQIGKQTVHYSAADEERDVDKTIGKMKRHATLEADRLQSDNGSVNENNSATDSDDDPSPDIFSDRGGNRNRANHWESSKLIDDWNVTQPEDNNPEPPRKLRETHHNCN